MTVAGRRYLAFQVNGIGFVLGLTHLLEIREQLKDSLDLARHELRLGIVGALLFRQTRIPAVDPTIRLDIASAVPLQDKAALVLESPEGNWGLLVDQVGLVVGADRLRPCELPALLRQSTSGCYEQVVLLDNEPHVVFNPRHYYGSEGQAR